jgi:hypothetical protein
MTTDKRICTMPRDAANKIDTQRPRPALNASPTRMPREERVPSRLFLILKTLRCSCWGYITRGPQSTVIEILRTTKPVAAQ